MLYACTGHLCLHKSSVLLLSNCYSVCVCVCVCVDAARASKEDVLLLYANKWQQHIRQSCVGLGQFLQVPDASPLLAAIQAAWLFTDQVEPFHHCQEMVVAGFRRIGVSITQRIAVDCIRHLKPRIPSVSGKEA